MKRQCLIALVLLAAGTSAVAQAPFEIRSYDAGNNNYPEPWNEEGIGSEDATHLELRFRNTDSGYFTLFFVHTAVPEEFPGRSPEMQVTAEAMLVAYPYLAEVTGVTGAALEVNGWKVDDTARELKVPSALVIDALSAFLAQSPYAPGTHGIVYSHASDPLVMDIPESAWGGASTTSARRPWVDASAGGSETKIPIEALGREAITRQGREANGDDDFSYADLGKFIEYDVGYQCWVQAIQVPIDQAPFQQKPIKIKMPIFVRRYSLAALEDPRDAESLALWGPERKLSIWAAPSVRTYYGLASTEAYSAQRELIVDFAPSAAAPLKALVMTTSGPLFIDSVTGFVGDGYAYVTPPEGSPAVVYHAVFELPWGTLPGTVWFFDAATWALREPMYGFGAAGSQGAVVLPVGPPPF